MLIYVKNNERWDTELSGYFYFKVLKNFWLKKYLYRRYLLSRQSYHKQWPMVATLSRWPGVSPGIIRYLFTDEKKNFVLSSTTIFLKQSDLDAIMALF